MIQGRVQSHTSGGQVDKPVAHIFPEEEIVLNPTQYYLAQYSYTGK